MVVANAVAALSEINEASPTGRPLIEMNAATINKLLTALNECTEWGQVFILDSLSNYTPKVANIYFFAKQAGWILKSMIDGQSQHSVFSTGAPTILKNRLLALAIFGQFSTVGKIAGGK